MRNVGCQWWVSGLLLFSMLAAAPMFADEKGQSILREAFQTLHAAKTMTADVTMEMKSPNASNTFKGTVAAMKPNFFRLEMQGQGAPIVVADGKNYFNDAAGASVYQKGSLDSAPTALIGPWEGEIDAFFGGVKNLEGIEVSYVGSEKVGGVDCEIVKAQMRSPDRTAVYAVGKSDRLIYRSTFDMGQGRTQTNTLTNIKLNVSKTAADFEFKPRPNARMLEPPDAKLLPVGEKAPDFELPAPGSGRLSLSESLKGKKAVIVNFWFYN